MSIVPPSIQQQINRVDRTRSLMIGMGAGMLAFWSIYRVLWSIYLAITYHFMFGLLVMQLVLWGVIGAAAAVTAIAFLSRYRADDIDETDRP